MFFLVFILLPYLLIIRLLLKSMLMMLKNKDLRVLLDLKAMLVLMVLMETLVLRDLRAIKVILVI